ncbi:hypothetical protein U1Q18_030973, partial [Sarracenia purpurea var. burkii]
VNAGWGVTLDILVGEIIGIKAYLRLRRWKLYRRSFFSIAVTLRIQVISTVHIFFHLSLTFRVQWRVYLVGKPYAHDVESGGGESVVEAS